MVFPDLEPRQGHFRRHDGENGVEFVAELGREIAQVQTKIPALLLGRRSIGTTRIIAIAEQEDFGVWNVLVNLVGLVFLERKKVIK